MLMSESQEISLGQSADPQIMAAYGLYEDPQIQKFIDAKGQEMVKVSHRSNIKYEFKILDSPIVNAFAVPGGYVYFTRGIMAHFNNEAEFAGVLGHEIGHIAARHSAKQYSQATLAQIGLTLGAVFAPEQFSDFVNAANTGVSLLFLKFGRDDETESDRLGVEYSTKVGYNAIEMANFFKTINRLQEAAGASIPTFLSTHPNPGDRYKEVTRLANKWQKQLNVSPTNLNINRESYLQLVDGIVYGEDPRQGFFENNTFYHPDLKFYFPVPANWQTMNSPTAVQMAPQDGNALMVLQLSQSKTLKEAGEEFVNSNSLVVIESKNTTQHGKPVLKLLAKQEQTDANGAVIQTLMVLCHFVQHDGIIYQLYGLALDENYNNYSNFFLNTLNNFKTLTDPNKLNRLPARLEVKSVPSATTLQKALQLNGVGAGSLEEHAILNGMQLSDQLAA
ncbi:MAG: M48 family metalloprotease, partial [Chitinophagales bacterium]|nr:M48 family metalloprotease [Chitinophagales bacterium]